MAEYVNPGIPFKWDIPGGFPVGSILEIQGMVDRDAERFAIDLLCNKGVAFHLNPRFARCPHSPDHRVVVRNSLLDGNWGDEEKSGGMDFPRGKPFTVKIKAEPTKYIIMFNDVEVFTYNYRFFELDLIDKVEVTGKVNLTYVKF